MTLFSHLPFPSSSVFLAAWVPSQLFCSCDLKISLGYPSAFNFPSSLPTTPSTSVLSPLNCNFTNFLFSRINTLPTSLQKRNIMLLLWEKTNCSLIWTKNIGPHLAPSTQAAVVFCSDIKEGRKDYDTTLGWTSWLPIYNHSFSCLLLIHWIHFSTCLAFPPSPWLGGSECIPCELVSDWCLLFSNQCLFPLLSEEKGRKLLGGK